MPINLAAVKTHPCPSCGRPTLSEICFNCETENDEYKYQNMKADEFFNELNGYLDGCEIYLNMIDWGTMEIRWERVTESMMKEAKRLLKARRVDYFAHKYKFQVSRVPLYSLKIEIKVERI